MVFGVFEANIFKVNINLAINYLSQTSAHIIQASAHLSQSIFYVGYLISYLSH